MEEEINRLQKSLEERNRTLQASASTAEQVKIHPTIELVSLWFW